ncbi:MAG: hypothetical protein HKO13_05640 [Sphingomonas sp.]|nr:hypothetical protein [Sphingomonas sp.]RZV50191.1 MAG: hypothetical protein EX258_05870 [Sphingomonadaceae bacterium]
MKSLFTAAAALSMIAAVPATAATIAQDAAQIAPGMEVVHDKTGDPVGQVVRIQGDAIIFSTDQHAEIAMPSNAFLAHEGKVLFAMTKDQINAAVAADKAKAEAAVQPGATVLGSAGTPVGTIDTIDDELVTVLLENGAKVQIPRSGTAASANGLVVGLTADELLAQVPADAIPEGEGEGEAEVAAEAEADLG